MQEFQDFWWVGFQLPISKLDKKESAELKWRVARKNKGSEGKEVLEISGQFHFLEGSSKNRTDRLIGKKKWCISPFASRPACLFHILAFKIKARMYILSYFKVEHSYKCLKKMRLHWKKLIFSGVSGVSQTRRNPSSGLDFSPEDTNQKFHPIRPGNRKEEKEVFKNI